jgi:hypothetical protein
MHRRAKLTAGWVPRQLRNQICICKRELICGRAVPILKVCNMSELVARQRSDPVTACISPGTGLVGRDLARYGTIVTPAETRLLSLSDYLRFARNPYKTVPCISTVDASVSTSNLPSSMNFELLISGVSRRIGAQVLERTLRTPSISRIIALSRRPLSGLDCHAKLEVVVLQDFTQYSEDVIRGCLERMAACGKRKSVRPPNDC